MPCENTIKRTPRYDFFEGTFLPSLRALDKPMAIACFGLVTFFLLRPLLSLPFVIAFISVSTFLPDDLEYLREELLFFLADLPLEAFLAILPPNFRFVAIDRFLSD